MLAARSRLLSPSNLDIRAIVAAGKKTRAALMYQERYNLEMQRAIEEVDELETYLQADSPRELVMAQVRDDSLRLCMEQLICEGRLSDAEKLYSRRTGRSGSAARKIVNLIKSAPSTAAADACANLERPC